MDQLAVRAHKKTWLTDDVEDGTSVLMTTHSSLTHGQSGSLDRV